MGLILNNMSGSGKDQLTDNAVLIGGTTGAAADYKYYGLAISGSALFQPGYNKAADGAGLAEQSFLDIRSAAPDAAYIFSGSVGGKNKTCFLGDVVISGSLTKSGGGAVDGSGKNERVAYWTDSDTISYSDNLAWDGDDLSLGSNIGLVIGGASEKIEGDGTNLTIASGGELDLTAGANLDVNITGTVDIEASSTFSIDGTGASNVTATSGALTVSTATSGDVVVTSAAAVDINATTGLTIDATTMSIDGTDDSNLTVTGAGKHLSVLLAGGGDQNLTISSAGTAADALDINASAGGIDIDAAAAVDILAASTLSAKGATGASFGDDTGTWEFDGSGAVTETGMASIVVNPSGVLTMQGGGVSTFGDDTGTIAFGGTGAVTTSGITTVALASSSTFDIDAEGALTLDGSAITIGGDSDVAVVLESSTLDVNSSGAITIDGTSTVSIDGADDMNFTITSSGASEDLTIQQIGANDSSILITAAGTGADAVSIDATAGSMVIAPSLIDGKTLTVGNTSSTYLKLTPHGTPASERVDLYNATGTADDAIKIHADAGGVSIVADDDSLFLDANGTDADALNIDSAGGIDVDSASAIAIDAATGDISVTSAAGSVNITGAEAAADAIVLDASNASGGIDLSVGSAVKVSLDTNSLDVSSGVVTNFDDTTAASAIGTAAVVMDGGLSVALDALVGDDLTLLSDEAVLGFGLNTDVTLTHVQDTGLTLLSDRQLQFGHSTSYISNGGVSGKLVLQATSTSVPYPLVAQATGGISLDASTDIKLDADGGQVYFMDDGTTILTVDMENNFMYPETDNAFSLGSSSKRFANIYTGDLHLANDRGNYTLVEEEDMLTIRNNRSGKWFKLMMEEIDPSGRDEGMQGAAPVLADSNDWEI